MNKLQGTAIMVMPSRGTIKKALALTIFIMYN